MIRDPYGPGPTVQHACDHVICGLTVKFNHHRVKVYRLHMFCLASLLIQAVLTRPVLFCALSFKFEDY